MLFRSIKVRPISWQNQLLADLHASNQHTRVLEQHPVTFGVKTIQGSQSGELIHTEPAAYKPMDLSIADSSIYLVASCPDLIRCQYILEVDTGRYRHTISQSASPRNRSPLRRSSFTNAQEKKKKKKDRTKTHAGAVKQNTKTVLTIGTDRMTTKEKKG